VTEKMRTIELTNDEFEQLLLVLGYAAGKFVRDGERLRAEAVMRLANAVNRDNPNWMNYAVPDERVVK
jgi:hypothetical protein